jgi:hypothetical protein
VLYQQDTWTKGRGAPVCKRLPAPPPGGSKRRGGGTIVAKKRTTGRLQPCSSGGTEVSAAHGMSARPRQWRREGGDSATARVLQRRVRQLGTAGAHGGTRGLGDHGRSQQRDDRHGDVTATNAAGARRRYNQLPKSGRGGVAAALGSRSRFELSASQRAWPAGDRRGA